MVHGLVLYLPYANYVVPRTCFMTLPTASMVHPHVLGVLGHATCHMSSEPSNMFEALSWSKNSLGPATDTKGEFAESEHNMCVRATHSVDGRPNRQMVSQTRRRLVLHGIQNSVDRQAKSSTTRRANEYFPQHTKTITSQVLTM